MQKSKGFTLIEILVALFVFTILSMILVAALHRVINAQAGAEDSANRLRKMQVAILLITRDVQQAVNRPIFNSSAKQEPAFIGTPQGFTFTHTGIANTTGTAIRSTLARTGYEVRKNSLFRITWSALDLADKPSSHARPLLDDILKAEFYYLDQDKRFRQNWPMQGQHDQPLPRAVKVVFTISKWGRLEQLFIIPYKVHDAAKLETKKS